MSVERHRPCVNIMGREGEPLAIASRVIRVLERHGMMEESQHFRQEVFESGYADVMDIASQYVTLQA